MKNLIKYTLGLPFILIGSAGVLLLGCMVSSITGEWEEVIDFLKDLWKPIKERKQ